MKSQSATTTSTKWFIISLGIPLIIVGVSAMAISYVTLIDVARINGLPLPELFPVVIDVGTVACMVAAAQFRLRALTGTWLAYLMFALLSAVSVAANAFHAILTADFTRTFPLIAIILAATPPVTLLAITHLVMKLIPTPKPATPIVEITPTPEPAAETTAAQDTTPTQTEEKPAEERAAAPEVKHDTNPTAAAATVERQDNTQDAETLNEIEAVTLEKIKTYYAQHGTTPSGKQVGDWLKKSARSGQRFMTKNFNHKTAQTKTA